MKILALDLGSTFGYAFGPSEDGHPCVVGSRLLLGETAMRRHRKERFDRRQDPRVSLFASWLDTWQPDLVVFEDVQFTSYTLQVQLWASYRAAVWLAFKPPVILECVPVATLKKFATGHGGATKDQMARSLAQRWPERFSTQKKAKELLAFDREAGIVLDNNATDALWLWHWAKESFKRHEKNYS